MTQKFWLKSVHPWASTYIFPGGAMSKLCLSFSGCSQCNANGRSQNALPFGLYPISLCRSNLTLNLLHEIFFTLRLSEILFLFTNCLISIFRAFSTNKSCVTNFEIVWTWNKVAVVENAKKCRLYPTFPYALQSNAFAIAA